MRKDALTAVGGDCPSNSRDRYHLFSVRPPGKASVTDENVRIHILPDAINSTETDPQTRMRNRNRGILMSATHDPVPFRFSSTSTRSSSLAGLSNNASLVEICERGGISRNSSWRRTLSDPIVHATRIAARESGLRGRQAANIAATRESSSKPRLPDATSLLMMAQ